MPATGKSGLEPTYNPIPKLSKSLLNKLKEYPYPGNVRELKNMIERAIILAGDDILREEHFNLNQATSAKHPDSLNVERNEKSLVEKALEKTNFNQKQAATLLGISRDALIRRMKKYDIQIVKKM